MKFFKLFEPLKISNITLSNRIVMPLMHLGLANDGFFTKKSTNFFFIYLLLKYNKKKDQCPNYDVQFDLENLPDKNILEKKIYPS